MFRTAAAIAIAVMGAAPVAAQAKSEKQKPAETQKQGGTPKQPETPKAGAQKQAGGAREEYLKINYLFNRELYELAIPQYEKLLEAHPDFGEAADVHYAIALACYQLALRKNAAVPAAGAAAPAPVQGPADGRSDAPSRPEAAETAKAGKAPANGPTTAETGPSLLRKAVRHLGDTLKAERFASRREAANLLGQCQLLLGNHEEALRAFSQALEGAGAADGSQSGALLGLADAHYLREDFPAAGAAYRKVLALEGEEAKANRERAEFYLAMELYRAGAKDSLAECLGLFDRAAARRDSPYRAEAQYMAALACEARGDGDGAVKRYGEIIAGAAAGPAPRDGKEAQEQGKYAELAALGLARAHFEAGKKAEAAAVLRKFIAERPGSDHLDEASLLLARSLGEAARSAEAVRLLQELRGSRRVGDAASLELARILIRNGKYDAAIRILRQVRESSPRSPRRGEIDLELARALVAGGDSKAALEILAGFAERHPDASLREGATYLEAYALLKEKRYDDSLAACRRFLEAFPGSATAAEVRQLEAEGLFLSGKYSEAAAAYEQSAASGAAGDPQRALKARFRIAQTAYLQGDYARARELLGALCSQAEEAAGKPGADEGLLQSLLYLAGESAYQTRDYKGAARDLGRFLARAAPPAKEGAAAAAGPEPEGLAAQVSDARFKRAHALQLAGDLKEARAAYEEALAAEPGGPHTEQMRFELGQIAFGLGDSAGARDTFSRLLKDAPASPFAPHARRLLGWLAFTAGDHQAAAAEYQKILTDHPDHEAAVEAGYQLGVALAAAGRSEEALAAFRRFAERHPGDERAPLVRLQEAMALSRLGKTEEAIALFEKLEKEAAGSETLPTILYEKAWCLRARKDPEAAARAYRAILALPGAAAAAPAAGTKREGAAPVAATARVELAELEFERDDYAGALELLKPALDPAAGPGDPGLRERALYRLAWCQHKLEDARGTLAAYEDFQRQFPESKSLPELAFLAANAQMRLGEHAAAAELFRLVAEKHPESREAEISLVSLGECLAEEAQFEKARERFAAFLKTHPESALAPRARFGFGWAEENLGHHDAAIAAYREVARGPATATAARAQYQIGQCFAAQEKYAEAVVELLQVVAKYSFPEWKAKALLRTGACFEALDDVEKARQHYREVIASHPDRDEAGLARERLKALEFD